MRNFLFATGLVAALGFSTNISLAQTKPNVSKVDPNTGLNSVEWLNMIGNIVDGSALVGIQGVLMINPLPGIITVTCDKWTLVGQNPYIKGNPTALRPYSITFVQTKGFDGYCKNGVVGHSGVRTLTAKLDAANGSFSDATIVTFGVDQ